MGLIKDRLSKAVHTKGEVGIEVEMEGLRLPKDFSNTYWKYEHDGSLAGYDNAEYVLKKPIKAEDVEKSLTSLQELLSKSSLQPTVRTGVHVHINVQDLTVQQVATMTTLYLVVEDLLLSVCGEGRQSNLFCLKGCEAEYLMYRAAQFFRTGELEYVVHDNIRYSGVNLAAIAKYGSVEFRSMRTPEDVTELSRWVSSLVHLRDLAIHEFETPACVLSQYSDFDPVGFVSKVVPYYAEDLFKLSDWEKKLKRGMRSAQDVAFCKAWKSEKEIGILPEPLQQLIKDHPHVDMDELLAMWEGRGE